MKLFFLDNEHTDYVITAESEDEAWRKLREKHGIVRPDGETESSEDLQPAYHPMFEVPEFNQWRPNEYGYTVDNPHDLVFVL